MVAAYIMQGRVLKSSTGPSINWVQRYGKGTIETRYVKRGNYIIGYVSSHSGCKMGCKFCYLTNQSQTTFDHVSPIEYNNQLGLVLNHYANLMANGMEPVNRININFMARGDPMANKYIIGSYPSIWREMNARASAMKLKAKVNISTIMPRVLHGHDLREVFGGANTTPPHLYYSLYSVNPTFRAKWLPNALPVETALGMLKDYENKMKDKIPNPVVFHWALIGGENDNPDDAWETAKVLRKYKFDSKFNLVQYNPHPLSNSVESNNNEKIFSIIADAVESGKDGVGFSRIVPRVGPDVYTSCGMFVNE